MRKEFAMTGEEWDKLLDASRPTVVMYLPEGQPMFDSPQENANRAWEKLGKKMGFDYMTVKPSDKGPLYFTAEVVEPDHSKPA